MIPVQCRVKHDPPHSYGDCIRACVASILEMDAEDVPHFADGDPTGTEAFTRMQDWLKTIGYAPFVVGFPGTHVDCPSCGTRIDDGCCFDDIFEYMSSRHPNIYYMLFGEAHGGGAHVVVGKGAEIVHNPAWIGGSLVGPHAGQWQIVVLVKL